MTCSPRPLVVLLVLILAGCSRSGDRGEGGREVPLTDVVTLELTFGAGDIDEAYILVRPNPVQGVGIDIEGNIMVVDEDYVKVFDSNGVPKRLVGGTGEGPGKLSRPERLWTSPNGYYAVLGRGSLTNFFRPDHSYLDRVDYYSTRPFLDVMAANQLLPLAPEAVYCLGETERVYSIDSQDRDRQNRSRKEIYLFYQDSDSLRVLAYYPQSNNIAGPMGRSLTTPALGCLLVAPLPGERIVYIHTYHDSRTTAEGSFYRLTFLDLDSMERTHLDHRYTPVEIEPWEPLSYPEDYRQRNPEQWRLTQQMNEIVENFLAERKYYSPLIHLCTDDRFVFAFTTTRNDSNQVKVDVFDTDRRSFLCSAWFPRANLHIWNGYAYGVNNYFGKDEYPQIEKYRIDPRVYGRR